MAALETIRAMMRGDSPPPTWLVKLLPPEAAAELMAAADSDVPAVESGYRPGP